MTKLDQAIKTVRVEWLILTAVIHAELEQGATDALEHQLARFEEAVSELEQAQQDGTTA